MHKRIEIPVIDVFAGPGGLGEGFSAFTTEEGANPFQIRLSVEKDKRAHQTLRLRSFYRQFPRGDAPELYYGLLRQEFSIEQFPDRLKASSKLCWSAWCSANKEAMCAALGQSDAGNNTISRRIDDALKGNKKNWILIGGPPCQAYSLVGRARNRGNSTYRIEDDQRSTLYREYLRIIENHRPTIFVMENVKGMLSAKLDEQKVFEKVLADLSSPSTSITSTRKRPVRYKIVPVVKRQNSLLEEHYDPKDFIVRCEKYGVPQQRHRVILIGIREDLADLKFETLSPSSPPSVMDVIEDLPPLRSGLSKVVNGEEYVSVTDDPALWLDTVRSQATVNGSRKHRKWMQDLDADVRKVIISTIRDIVVPEYDRGSTYISSNQSVNLKSELHEWFSDARLQGVCNHETRSHLDLDLARYMFTAAYGKVHGVSPTLDQFPRCLIPNHTSADKNIFKDRFRVQLEDQPSSTVTSHISKDGHYFIHPDPSQCRSLTVREAARLQTFPDNYFFCGPRTSQYTQVGNAVPPWLAKQIAKSIWQALVDTGRAV